MILDRLENAERYLSLNSGFIKAIEFLRRSDLRELNAGRHEVDGDLVYAIVENTTGRKKEDAQLEAHEKYIDIQLVLQGTDNMGWKQKSSCLQVATEYQPQADIQFYDDEPDIWLRVEANMFAIFYPEDAHMPLISTGNLHKVIAKVALNQSG